jgi:hypothetical protein
MLVQKVGVQGELGPVGLLGLAKRSESPTISILSRAIICGFRSDPPTITHTAHPVCRLIPSA